MNKLRDLSGVSFLIIDDNVHMRSILRSILSGFGARTFCEASDGAEGLEAVLDRQPDFILCDWIMKPLGGSDFLKTLRADQDPFVCTTPVVIVSAHSNRSTIIEATRVGIHGFLAKPVSPAVLYRHVITILEKQMENGRSKGILTGVAKAKRPKMPKPQPKVNKKPKPHDFADLALL